MFNNHTMSVVTDLRILGPQIYDTNLLIIAAITTSDCSEYPNTFNAGILVPPVEILMAWADGQPLVMENQYPAYLLTKEPDDMIAVLLAAMTKKNIILWIPQDEFNIFGPLLMQHLSYQYGITCNYMNIPFSINQYKIPFIISRFFMIDVMTAEDYLATYPANLVLPDFVIMKLASEMPVMGIGNTFMDYANHFNQLNASKAVQKQPVEMASIVDPKVGGS